MDLMAGIGAVTQAIGIAKTLKEVEKTYDEATYKMKISELIGALTDAKLALAEAKEDMAAKDAEIERLKITFQAQANLVVGDGDYKYLVGSDGAKVGFPVCPKCEQMHGRIIQLKQDGPYDSAKCPGCDSAFRPVTNYLLNGNTAEHQRSINMKRSLERLNVRNGFYG